MTNSTSFSTGEATAAALQLTRKATCPKIRFIRGKGVIIAQVCIGHNSGRSDQSQVVSCSVASLSACVRIPGDESNKTTVAGDGDATSWR
jgi:hypothetical protein